MHESIPARAGVCLRAERPLLTLRSSHGLRALHLHEVWAYRELLVFLAWRELKLRYRQTALGVMWAVLQPLLPMLIFTLTLGKVVGVPSDGAPYAVFVYAALLPWTFFANAVTSSTTSVVGNASLITKVYFPRLIIPAAAVLSALVDLLIAFVMLSALMVWYRLPVHAHLVMAVPLTILVGTLALAVGMLTSAMSVKYRDVRHALPFVIQLWMFATPIVFSASLVPEQWRWLLAINPLSGIVSGFRSAVLGLPFRLDALAISAIASLVLLIGSAYVFRRFERTFADVI